jgi:hypothetical protein
MSAVAVPPAAAAPKDSKHAPSSSASAPRKVRFNVGSKYQVLDVIGEGPSLPLSLPAWTDYSSELINVPRALPANLSLSVCLAYVRWFLSVGRLDLQGRTGSS